MKYFIVAILAMIVGLQVLVSDARKRIEELEKNQAALVNTINAHYVDSTNCVTTIYKDITETRLSLNAIAKSFKLTEAK